MINYKIISDEQNLIKFIEWLPELKPHEVYYIALLARGKYFPELANVKTDKYQLARFTCKKENIFNKIKQLECPLGSYMRRDLIVPQEAIALYINLNPRDLIKANKQAIHKLVDLSLMHYNGFNPHFEVMSEVQKSIGTKHFVDIDFDTKDMSVLNDIYSFINQEACKILVTRGGFHLIVETKKIHNEFKHTWYKNITKLNGCDIQGDALTPVPYTIQGGFIPFFKENL